MRVTDKAIVLQVIRYQEKRSIVKLYTRSKGLITLSAVPGSSPSSKIRQAHLQPMNLLEVVLISKENRDVQQMTEASCYHVYSDIPVSVSKISILQFMNEVLIKSLKEQYPNQDLFDLIEAVMLMLDQNTENYNNLHVYFLLELSRYLGIEPNNNCSAEEPYFDCREGRFSRECLAFPLGLGREESAIFSNALNGDLLKEKVNNMQRRVLLEALQAYYQHHLPGFSYLKSLEVLREVVQ